MDAQDPIWRSPAVQQAAAAGQFGALIRMTRTARGLSLVRVGHLVRYSASTLSRIETGQRKLVDVTELRMFADTLGIPPHLFGLTSAATPAAGGPASPTLLPVPTTVCQTPEGGDDTLHRRQLLAGLVGVTGVALLGPSTQPAAATAAPTADAYLQTLLGGPQRVVGQPSSVPILRARLADARATYEACRYHNLAVSLPEVIATAQASLDEATGQRHEQVDDPALVTGPAQILAHPLERRAAQVGSRGHERHHTVTLPARTVEHLPGGPTPEVPGHVLELVLVAPVAGEPDIGHQRGILVVPAPAVETT
ncbi:MAG: helix-turn-helix domain-containing protein [Actinomycetota bacterium]|nr:helix-turn-helix domain-containing protein [Actinomycetota bacterium]